MRSLYSLLDEVFEYSCKVYDLFYKDKVLVKKSNYFHSVDRADYERTHNFKQNMLLSKS